MLGIQESGGLKGICCLKSEARKRSDGKPWKNDEISEGPSGTKLQRGQLIGHCSRPEDFVDLMFFDIEARADIWHIFCFFWFGKDRND